MPEHSLLVVSSGQVASMVFLMYDICLTFDDEVNSIWNKPNNSWIKWQFLFTRYFALAAQITNRTIEHLIETNKLMGKGALKNWYMCQAIIGSILMTAVEIVLMARVFALYKKNLWVGLLFAALILGESTAVVVGTVVTRPGDNFTASNVLLSSPHSYTYFGAGAIVSQVTILVLTLAKYKVAVDHGWDKIPIMMLMVRDGTVAFFILLFVTTMTVVATSMQDDYGPIGNSWFLSIVACAGCRLIINMQNLPTRSEVSTDNPARTVQLSTVWNDAEFELTDHGLRREYSIP